MQEPDGLSLFPELDQLPLPLDLSLLLLNAVVYNVLGSGRTINVQNVYLQGHLVAPYNTLNQPSGNIVGKVIAGNIPATLNINRSGSQCFVPS